MAHSEELRTKIFNLKNEGKSLGEISKALDNIPRSTIQSILASNKNVVEEKTYNIICTWEEIIECKKYIEEAFDTKINDFTEINGEYIIGVIKDLERSYMLARQEIQALDADIEKLKNIKK